MNPPADNSLVKIGAICRLFGVSRHTLYSWERAGAVVPKFRSPGGTRYYDLEAVRTALGKPGRSYGATTYNPSGVPENPVNCVWSIAGRKAMVSRQCSLRRGHGPSGLYCRRHAVAIGRQLEESE